MMSSDDAYYIIRFGALHFNYVVLERKMLNRLFDETINFNPIVGVVGTSLATVPLIPLKFFHPPRPMTIQTDNDRQSGYAFKPFN
jgi:hypothetical protein